MTFIRNFSRILVGLVFVFSGFVKGIDPLGTAYRIEDYFIAYGTDWAIPLTLTLSVILCTLELFLGIILLLNIRINIFSLVLLPLMIFFTFLTLYDAVYEPVPDCGCFGDAIKLSNWNTFFKNLVLIVFVIIIFINRNRYRSPFAPRLQDVIAVAFASIFAIFSLFNYQHLPLLDFREWKTGSDMEPDEKGEAKIYLTFKNIETGETREYLSPDYPWEDSAWMARWEFVDQRLDESGLTRSHELLIEDREGMDVTDNFIGNPDFQLLVIAYDLGKAHRKAFKAIEELYQHTDREGISCIVITSSLQSEVEEFTKGLDPGLEFYHADDIVLKTMIRSNPGLMLMKDGVVLGKWHYNDLPSFEELEKDFFSIIHD